MEMTWVDIRVALPAVIETPNRFGTTDDNFVLVRYKQEYQPCAGSQYQTSNTVYVNKFPNQFTHWAYITDPSSAPLQDSAEEEISDYLYEQHVRDITFRNCI